MDKANKIATCLWFDDQAEEAAHFYTSVFQNSSITSTSHYGEAEQEVHGKKPGSVMTVEFELNGNSFTALNGGPHFQFNEAVSLVINCDNQEEIDYYWDKLSANPDAEQCGWLKDKYGLSWQVIPTIMAELFGKADSEKSDRMMEVMLKMKKIDIEALKNA